MIKGYELTQYDIIPWSMPRHRERIGEIVRALSTAPNPFIRPLLRHQLGRIVKSTWGLASLN